MPDHRPEFPLSAGGKSARRRLGALNPAATDQPLHENTSMMSKSNALPWLWLSAAVLALDQVSKWWA
ncbi:MAG: hypothetical protein ABI247_01100, partial [Rhodanobacter sp.]